MKDFFVGIDSDGTVFDSMTPKHGEAFIPAVFEIWGLADCKDEFIQLWNEFNLYSQNRGKNRFLALQWTFNSLNASFEGISALERWIESGSALSSAGLRHHLEKESSVFLQDVLRWSVLSDRLFEAAAKDIAPFVNAKETIAFMSEMADLAVVSSAAADGIKKDWERAGLMTFMSFVGGQEQGGKDKQLAEFTAGGYVSGHVLLLGDTVADLEAAKACDVLFYPIIPGEEGQSWERLKSSVFSLFLDGHYSGDAEAKEIERLLRRLR